LLKYRIEVWKEAVSMPTRQRVDVSGAQLLLALNEEPRGTVLWLAERLKISRNTAQARLAVIDRLGALFSFERRVDPAALGYPLSAFIMVRVMQRMMPEFSARLAEIPEVIEAVGLSGDIDVMIRVVAKDSDNLYLVAGRILSLPGTERTDTYLEMWHVVNYRVAPLLKVIAGDLEPM
jgi:DNA-binding Lrp family transcriptional regulator